MSKEEKIKEIETLFSKRMKEQKIKYKSKDYYIRQMEFFCGAMVALGESILSWTICIQTNREIIKNYE